jgi:hypothetical protein
MTEIVSVIKTNLALSLEYVFEGFEVSRIQKYLVQEGSLRKVKIVRLPYVKVLSYSCFCYSV